MIVPVIMAGGSGTRLWPLSRSQYPKQFLKLNSELSMLQETVQRLAMDEEVTIICNEEHRFIVAEQMRQLQQPCSIILEPEGKNTAPAIALAALNAAAKGVPEASLLILAADHVIADIDAFTKVVKTAEPLSDQGKMVTFGIVPSHPETGYGYIRQGEEAEQGVFGLAEFVEKPDLSTAEQYVNSGQYLWNSGMFMFRADQYLQALGRYRNDILAACQRAMASTSVDNDFIRVDATAFSACSSESVDYAVMEPLSADDSAADAVVVPLDAGWSDVGSWSAVWDIKEKDAEGNVKVGDVLAVNTKDSFVYSSDRLVSTLGVEDLIIVDTKDAVMVANKHAVQDVKELVNQLKEASRTEHKTHREVYRPWGKYDSVDFGERYQVKRITVNPGAKLSIQMHHHRAEHWVVVSGSAKVKNGDQELFLSENQSTYIPVGVVHGLENPGRIPLELIEVQSGSYLGEDDIVRFSDLYGRT